MSRKNRKHRQRHSQKPATAPNPSAAFGLPAFMQRPQFIIAGFAFLCLALLGVLLIDLTGHDYMYFLPRLLDTHIFYLQNGFALQDYTASFCAGIFSLGSMQAVAQSLPQGLSFLLGPVAGAQGTYILATGLAGVGIYLCARFWGLAIMPACMAGIAMSFSGYLLTRLVAGHLIHFNYGFAPIMAACLLYGTAAMHDGRTQRATALGCLAALLLAWLIHSGLSVVLFQLHVTIALILLICGAFDRHWFKTGLYCAVWLAVGLLISAPKIESVLAMNQHFTRNLYSLPGFGFFDLLVALSHTLFWVPSVDLMNDIFQNKGGAHWGWQEWYFGFTPISLVVLLAGLLLGYKKLPFRNIWQRRPVVTGLAAILLLLPIALNIYEPSWNQVLKSIPILNQSSSMTRWFVIYLPMLSLLLGWAWSHWQKIPLAFPLIMIAVLTWFQFQTVQTGLERERYYNPAPIINNWTWQSENIPEIDEVRVQTAQREDGTLVLDPVRGRQNDHVFVEGQSNAMCYEAMFGYTLESYPITALRPGDIMTADADGNLGLKNPACYVYPEENMCEPGDHFKQNQVEAMMALVNYDESALIVSSERRVANIIGGLAFALTGGFLVFCVGVWVYRVVGRWGV